MSKQMQTRRSFLATFAGASALALTACGGSGKKDEGKADAAGSTSNAAAGDGTDKKSAGVMTYKEYVDAPLDTEVTIEAFVQGRQSWLQDTASLYLQDADGGYFVYSISCTEDEYAMLVDGKKIKVNGYKSEWSGEVEIVDGSFELEDGSFIAEPVDLTDKLGSEELINYQNQKASFSKLTVAPSTNPDGQEVAFLYNYDGSGTEGDDLYINVSDGKGTYGFTVESYLTGQETELYRSVTDLKVGDTVNIEAFLYWYEGPNPHIISISHV